MLATVAVAVLVTFLALLGAGGVAFALFRISQTSPASPKELPNAQPSEYVSELGAKLAALEVTVQGLPSLWEEERERAKKHADRAAASYRGAESILASIEAEEADEGEDPDIYPDDEDGGREPEVRQLHSGLGLSREEADAELRIRAQAALAELQSMGL